MAGQSAADVEGDRPPYGIQEIVLEFDTGDEEILKPQMRDEFRSYELHQAATYLDSLSHQLQVHRK